MSALPLRPTVFYLHRLGDMVMLSALVQFLHRRYHAPCQVVGTGSWTPCVYQGSPDVERVWAFGRHLPFPLSRGWRPLVRALRESAPGPIYVPEYHRRQLPRVRRMLAVGRVDPARLVFNADIPERVDERWADVLVRFGQLTPAGLNAADYPSPSSSQPWTPRLYVLERERTERDAWLRSRGWSGRELLLIQPSNHRTVRAARAPWRRARPDNKAWPIECWVELLRRIHAHSPHALLVLRGAPDEDAALGAIQAAARLAEVVVAGLGLRATFALCECAHSMISVDTGPAHAAAALGLPLLMLYGAMPQRVYLPRGCGGSPVTLDTTPLAMSRSLTLLFCEADRRIANARSWVQRCLAMMIPSA